MVVSADDYKNGVGVSPMERYLKDLDTKAVRTKELYLKLFTDFVTWTENHPDLGYDAEKLLEIHRDFMVNHPDKVDYIPRIVNEWIEIEGEKRQWKKATTNNPRKAIKLFFKVNNAPLNLSISKVANEGVEPLWIDDLRDLMNNRKGTLGDLPLRNKAIIMTLKDTGLRVSDIMVWHDKDDRVNRGLLVETFLSAEKHYNATEEEFRYIPKYKTKKEGVQAHVHIGPEAIEALNDYIGDRTEGPIFLTREGTPMSRNTITNTVIRCFDAFPRNYSSHSLRKMHYTRLSGKMKENAVKLLQGKTIEGSTAPYFAPHDTGKNISILTKLYMDAYNEIRIKETTRTRPSDNDLHLQLANMQGKIDRMEPVFIWFEKLINKEKELDRVIESSIDV